jgi:hypothetical protein
VTYVVLKGSGGSLHDDDASKWGSDDASWSTMVSSEEQANVAYCVCVGGGGQGVCVLL